MKNKLVLCSMLLATLSTASLVGCGKKTGSQDDPNKANLHVRTLNKGIGITWLKNAAKMFEELYAESDDFQTGRKGVKIHVDGDTALSGEYLENNPLNDDVYFTEQIMYRDMVNKGKFLNITDVLRTDLEYYGDPAGTTIESKIDETMLNYLDVNGSYYGIPFYDSFYGLVYDVSLFKEEGLYLMSDGSFGFYDDPDISVGTDNIPGTPDDGLPATYEEFGTLLEELYNRNITGFVTASNAKEYVADYLHNVYADYEGVDNMVMTLTLSGEATDLADVDNSGNISYLEQTTITPNNGYMLTKQVGRYKALTFLKNQLMGRNNYYRFVSTHTDAQSAFIKSKNSASAPAVAMIMEGSWWENEAATTIKNEAERTGVATDYAIMPIPFESAEKAAACNYTHTYLSKSQSFGVVSANTSNPKLAKEFMRFVHCNKMLSKFTADTSITRPLNYEVTAADQSKLSNYAKSLIYLKGHSNIVYPYSSLQKEVNNPSYFKAYYFAWKATVNGTPYMHPWDYFRNNPSNSTPEKYFKGIYDCYYDAWPTLN